MRTIMGTLEEQLHAVFDGNLIFLQDKYFDAIALHETGVYLFKLCKYKGIISGTAEDKNWLSVYLEQKTAFCNPTRECIIEAKLFAQEFGLRLNTIRPFIVFSAKSSLETGNRANHVLLYKVSQLTRVFENSLPKKNPVFAERDLHTLVYDLTVDSDEESYTLFDKPFSNRTSRVSYNFLDADLLNYERPGPSELELERIKCSKYLKQATKTNTIAALIYVSIAAIMIIGLPIERAFAIFPWLLSIKESRTAIKCELADNENNILIQMFFILIYAISGLTIILPYLQKGI